VFSGSVFQAVGCNVIRETCKDFCGFCGVFLFNELIETITMCCGKRTCSVKFFSCADIFSHVYM